MDHFISRLVPSSIHLNHKFVSETLFAWSEKVIKLLEEVSEEGIDELGLATWSKHLVEWKLFQDHVVII